MSHTSVLLAFVLRLQIIFMSQYPLQAGLHLSVTIRVVLYHGDVAGFDDRMKQVNIRPTSPIAAPANTPAAI